MLEKQLSSERVKDQNHTVKLDEEQVHEIMDELTDRVEWATNRIVDESQKKSTAMSKPQPSDLFSTLIRWTLLILFGGFGVGMLVVLFTNWSSYWTGGVNYILCLSVILIGITSIIIGVEIFREKDRNYVISLFSALVALVALIVTLIKG